MKQFYYIFATVFGIGFFPKISGTIASIFIALIWMFFIPEYWFYNPMEKEIFYDNNTLMLLILILLSIIGFKICTESEKHYGHDASVIVYDEIIGYLFAVIFLPKTIMIAIYALILFRIFDIAKPFYINKLQSLPRGYGIMIDDIAAGIYSNICLQALYRLRPQFFI